jgi:hypothetical protein
VARTCGILMVIIENFPCCVLPCWNFQECNPTLNKDLLFVNVILFLVGCNTGIFVSVHKCSS